MRLQGSAYAIGSDGNLYAWGTNVYGNLGDGSMTDSDTPVVVSLPTGVTPKAISGGYDPHTPSARTGTSTPGETTSTVSSAMAA